MKKSNCNDSLETRMKSYEACYRNFLTLGVPKIIRLDMRAGHTFCKEFKKPFDEMMCKSMIDTTIKLCENIPGVRIGYVQSDEISLILNDDYSGKADRFNCFFEGNLNKILSLSASMATRFFNEAFINNVISSYGIRNVLYADDINTGKTPEIYIDKFFKAEFDSRVFCLPSITEIHNYLVWRQQDATRNSIEAIAQANFPQSDLQYLHTGQLQDKLMLEKGINWNDFPIWQKRGTIVVRKEFEKVVTVHQNGKECEITCKRHQWTNEFPIPILTQAPGFIEYLYTNEKKAVTEKEYYRYDNIKVKLDEWKDKFTGKKAYGIPITAEFANAAFAEDGAEDVFDHFSSYKLESTTMNILNTDIGHQINFMDVLTYLEVSKYTNRDNPDNIFIGFTFKCDENKQKTGWIFQAHTTLVSDNMYILFFEDEKDGSFTASRFLNADNIEYELREKYSLIKKGFIRPVK